MSDHKREELIYMAKICEQTERYNEMLDYMRQILKHPQTESLQVEDRNLLSVAYKNCVGTLRTSWRIIETLEKKEESKAVSPETQKHLELIKQQKKAIEKELHEICEEIINTLDDRLIPSAKDTASQVFYLKIDSI